MLIAGKTSAFAEQDDLACFESVPDYCAVGSNISQTQQSFVQPSQISTTIFGASATPSFLGLSKIVTNHVVFFQSKNGCSAMRHNVWSSEGLPIYITMVLNDTNIMAKPLALPMVHNSPYKHYLHRPSQHLADNPESDRRSEASHPHTTSDTTTHKAKDSHTHTKLRPATLALLWQATRTQSQQPTCTQLKSATHTQPLPDTRTQPLQSDTTTAKASHNQSPSQPNAHSRIVLHAHSP